MNEPYNFQPGDPVRLTVRSIIVQNPDNPEETLYFRSGEIGVFHGYTPNNTHARLSINDENGENHAVEFETNYLTFPKGVASRDQLPQWKLDHNWKD